jgi:hypothetical protein
MSAPSRRERLPETAEPQIGEFRARHMTLAETQIATDLGRSMVTVDEGESPLVWLARRRGRDGRAMIAPYQLLAGERLRSDFTRANMMPRTTSNWDSPLSTQRRAGGGGGVATEAAVAARQRVRQALDAAGPEFSGLLLDVCCFLKRLEDVERERLWPTRSAKVVLQLALDRLARYYGYAAETRGRKAPVRTWLAEDAEFSVDGECFTRGRAPRRRCGCARPSSASRLSAAA